MTDNREHTVYRAYAYSGALLYVGCTVDLPARISVDHRRGKWWDMCREITIETFPNRDTARAAEAEAIRAEFPVFNLVGTGAGLSTLRGDKPIREHVTYVPRHAERAA